MRESARALVMVLAGSATCLVAAQPVQRLSAGSVIEADLKGGEAHRYDVELTAGQYFSIAVDQRGIDVRPVIIAPDGTNVYEYDHREFGIEPASVIAAHSGIYRLELRTEVAGAPVGRYRLEVEAVRPPSADDEARTRVMAMQLEGFPLVRSRTPDYRRAQQIYERVLAGWQELADRPGEAHALTALRFIAGNLDDFAGGLAYAQREAAAYAAIGDDYGEARALRMVSINSRILGDATGAFAPIERALALHRAAGRASAENLALADLANAHGTVGDFGIAMEYGYEAVALARRRGDPLLEARAWSAVGLIHVSLGELEIGVDAFRRARTLAPNDETLQGDMGGRIGAALIALGDLDGAQTLLEEALALWTRRNWRGFQTQALVALGDLYLLRGTATRARELFELAATRSAETQYPLGELIARRRLAETLLALGQVEDADASLTAATALLDRIGNPNVQALVLAAQARVALATQDVAGARQRAEDALRLTETARARADSVRIQAAMRASIQSVYHTLVEVHMTAHAANPTGGFDKRAFEVSERARARSLLETVLTGRSRAEASPSGALIDQIRLTQRELGAKAMAFESARQRKDAPVAAAASREIDELAARLAILDGRMRRENPALASVVSPEPLTVDAIQRDVLDDSTVLVEYLLAEPHSYAWVVSRDSITSHRLAPRSRIEEAARQFQEGIAQRVRGTAAGPAPIADASMALSKLIADPLRDIPAGRRLLIVAPGILQNVPLAALPLGPDSSQRILARYEIVYAPSASVVAAMRGVAGQDDAPSRTLAIFADPVFEANDPRVARRTEPVAREATATAAPSPLRRALRTVPSDTDRAGLGRLPFTRLEADTIAGLVPRGSVLKATGFDANVRTVTDGSLAEYRIVHFATHGVLDTRTPELSGLVFSLVDQAGRPQDGFLRLHNLDRLRLNAELVVLSGCETALGRAIEGEGAIGLTRGFIAGGARRVIASLWKVDDLATAELMRAFYRQLLERKLPAVAALRAAQREMAASPRWSDPYYWAGFVVQGEWR